MIQRRPPQSLRPRVRMVYVIALLAASTPAFAVVGVLTHHNDNARTGVNAQETSLAPSTVSAASFGLKFSQPVDGYVYAQPLYVPDVATRGGRTHNVVYVATQHNSVYAFDADDSKGRNARPLWEVHFANKRKNIRPVLAEEVSCNDIVPEIGITGTPVIDPIGGTLYVVTKSKSQERYVQHLHALDIRNGSEKFDGPVEITATVPGTGTGSVDGQITFDPLSQNQRSALLLQNGVIYIAWAAYCDVGPYHGWLMAYDATTLAQVAAVNLTPDGYGGGIWHGGGGPSADSDGNIYVVTGNGTFDAAIGGANYGDSVLKFRTSGGGLELVDYFTPFDQAVLDQLDLDLGSCAPLLLPDQPGEHPHLAVIGSKPGTVYVLDRDNLGHFHAGDDSQIVQSLADVIGWSFGTPAFWNGRVYFQGIDVLKALSLSGGTLSSVPVSRSSTFLNFPAATPVVSSNGLSDGIVWILQTDGYRLEGPAILRAFDANDLSQELYDSEQLPDRDRAGPAVKFAVPTVANGKVYVGAKERLHVYGLRAEPARTTGRRRMQDPLD